MKNPGDINKKCDSIYLTQINCFNPVKRGLSPLTFYAKQQGISILLIFRRILAERSVFQDMINKPESCADQRNNSYPICCVWISFNNSVRL